MKKLSIIALAFMMVMAFSFSAMANLIPADSVGDFSSNFVNGDEITVRANIAPYASISVTQPYSYFADQENNTEAEVWLLGAPGLYGNDGTIFESMLVAAFGPKPMIQGGLSGGSEDNVGKFSVETNAPIMIGLDFDDNGWLTSETILAVWERDPIAATGAFGNDFDVNQAVVQEIFPNVNNIGDYVAAFGTANVDNMSKDASILQNYQYCKTRDYELYVGFHLRKITEQQAGKYSGIVNLTITEAGEPS